MDTINRVLAIATKRSTFYVIMSASRGLWIAIKKKKKPLYAPRYINLHVNVFHPSVSKEEQLLHLDFGHIGVKRPVDIYRRINVKNWMIPFIFVLASIHITRYETFVLAIGKYIVGIYQLLYYYLA